MREQFPLSARQNCSQMWKLSACVLCHPVPCCAMLCHAVPEHSFAKPGKSGEAQQFPVAKHWTPSDNSFAIRNFANANDAFPLCSPRISSFFTPSRHCFNAWHVPNRLGIWCQGLARAFQVPFLGHAKFNEVQQ